MANPENTGIDRERRLRQLTEAGQEIYDETVGRYVSSLHSLERKFHNYIDDIEHSLDPVSLKTQINDVYTLYNGQAIEFSKYLVSQNTPKSLEENVFLEEKIMEIRSRTDSALNTL